MALLLIKPGDLPAAASVDTDAAVMVQNGDAVERATPQQVVDAGRPIASEAEAVTGTDNTKAMTPLTVRQAIDADTSGAVAQAQAAADAAEASALDAESAEEQTGLDALATAADRVQTGLDVIATAADRVQTGLDAAATAADAIATASDRVQTGLDAAATGADAAATAADRVQTGLDAGATAADRVQTGLDASAADASADAAAASAATLTYASQAEAEAGVVSDRVMSPLRTQQHMLANALGWGQTWQSVIGSRAGGTSYQNTTGRPIAVFISISSTPGRSVQVSVDNATWITVGSVNATSADVRTASFIVPDQYYYRIEDTVTLSAWSELR